MICPECKEDIEPIEIDDSFDCWINGRHGTQYESHLECPECEEEINE